MAGVAQLRRFQTTIFKDKTASDTAQVPASGAAVSVYKHGATVKTAGTVLTTNTVVAVYNVGRILAADNVQLGVTSASQMTVVSVDSDTQLTLRSTIGSSISIAVGDRLVVYSALASLYSDPLAVTTLTNPIASLASSGLLAFYTPETRFDYIVSGSGLTTTLYIDNEGGWMRGGTSWVNVKDYATFQAAANALSSVTGGTLYVPAGTYDSTTTPSVAAITFTGIGGRLRIVGDGITKSKVLHNGSASTDLITVSQFSYVEIENISLAGINSSGAGRGIVFDGCSYSVVKNCSIEQFPSWGIETVFTSAVDNVENYFESVNIQESVTNGAVKLVAGTYHPVFVNCRFAPAAGNGVYVNGSVKTTFIGCTFEQSADAASTDGDTSAMLVMATGSHMTTVRSCWFETTASNVTPNNWFIFIGGLNIHTSISECYFVRTSAAVTSARVLKSKNSGASAVYGLLLDHPLAIIGGIPAGTDDVVFGSNDTIIMLRGGTVSKTDYSTATLSRRMRVSSSNWNGISREASNFRNKPYGLSTNDRDNLVDLAAGDIIYNTTTNVLNFYNGTAWGAV